MHEKYFFHEQFIVSSVGQVGSKNESVEKKTININVPDVDPRLCRDLDIVGLEHLLIVGRVDGPVRLHLEQLGFDAAGGRAAVVQVVLHL